MPLPSRDSQTRIKHRILREYAGAWLGIIATGMKGRGVSAANAGREITLEFVYLDAFAGPGVYEPDEDGSVPWGSPIIATEALCAAAKQFEVPGLSIRVSTIAIEQKYGEELVRSSIKSGLPLRVREAEKIDRDARGADTIIRGDCRHYIDDITAKLRPTDFVLAFIDPFGESMSMRQLRRLLSHAHADAITLFPTAIIDMHGGSACKPRDSLTTTELVNLDRTEEHFDTREWEHFACSGLQQSEREEAYTALYDRQIRKTDDDLIVKNIGLQFSKVGRTGYHLFLSTRDADGALRMNRILRSAEISEHWELWLDTEARLRAKFEGQVALFEPMYKPPAAEAELTREQAAELVRPKLPPPGSIIGLKRLYAAMAEDVLTAGEIKKGLGELKRQKVVDYPQLKKKDDPITVL